MTDEILIVGPDTTPKHFHRDALPRLGEAKHAPHQEGTLARCTCGTWFVAQISFTWPTKFLSWYHISWFQRKIRRRIREIESAERTAALREKIYGQWQGVREWTPPTHEGSDPARRTP